MLNQKVLFDKNESLKIRNYSSNLQHRIIKTYHKSVNNGEVDENGGRNLAEHISWESNLEYNWMHEKILKWVHELDLPITKLGYEFILQKYPKGYEFKPHIDDVMGPNNSVLRKRYYTILIQLSDKNEYDGGELWVNDVNDVKLNQEIGNVSIFGTEQLHWVTKIQSGERWSCTIFLEKDSLKKTLV